MTGFVQIPRGAGEIFLDHVAHWVPDVGAAADALGRLGFAFTPLTEHAHAPAPGAPVVSAGSANHCVMLGEGYLEVLTPTGDTPIGREVRAGIARYTGLHLAAFAVTDAPAQRERLLAAGFPQRAVVALERATATADGGEALLRFTVIRPEPGCLAEGRVQFLTHHTPDLLWQPRFMTHPNGAERLTDLVFCVADPDEAAGRYERYLARPPRAIAGGHLIELDRGRLALLDAASTRRALPGLAIPALPFMAAIAVRVGALERTREALAAGGLDYVDGGSRLTVVVPPALGGAIAFLNANANPPWLD